MLMLRLSWAASCHSISSLSPVTLGWGLFQLLFCVTGEEDILTMLYIVSWVTGLLSSFSCN